MTTDVQHCLFCRADSSQSRSVEHVVPESLWNTKHILPKGVVCDGCNNYFSREVEKPFLESPAVSQLRFSQVLPNKRGKVPSSSAVLFPGYPAEIHRSVKNPHVLSLDISPEAIGYLKDRSSGTIILPHAADPPEERVVSRFLAKMALEAMALRLLRYPAGIEYLVGEIQLDPLRNYARKGQPSTWPYCSRRIYDPDRTFLDDDRKSLQTVHEFDFLVTKSGEWYFVFILFGLELAINMGGPEVDGYHAWLSENAGASPLYMQEDE